MNLASIYSENYTKRLFNNLSETYFLNNFFSFGLANLIRKINTAILYKTSEKKRELTIVDFMSGKGENNKFLFPEKNHIISVDFSSKMQNLSKTKENITKLNENVLTCTLKESSVDAIISSFGLKTLSLGSVEKLAQKTRLSLKENGVYSYCEFNFNCFNKFIFLNIISLFISISVIIYPNKKAKAHYNFISYTRNFKGNVVYTIFKRELPNTKKINLLGIVIFIYGKNQNHII